MKTKIFLVAVGLLVFYEGVAQSLPRVKMETFLGNIVVEIDTLKAPVTGMNFLDHVHSNTFRNAVFYRVVRVDNQPDNDLKIEVIQGGIYTEPRFGDIKPIEHETTDDTGIKHKDGTISMARMGPGTASTEFFICIGDQPQLDFGGKRNPDGQGFAAFGKVVEGMNVVLDIHQQKDKNQTLLEKIAINKLESVK